MLSQRRKCRIDRSPRPRSLRGTESDLVTTVRIQQRAAHRLDEIYRYSRDRWGDDQAEKNITGLLAAFDKIATTASHQDPFRPNSASRASSFVMSTIASIGAISRVAISGS